MNLRRTTFKTPLGDMIAIADETHLHMLEFHDRKNIAPNITKLSQKHNTSIQSGLYAPLESIQDEIHSFFNKELSKFETPITMHGTPFTCDVWRALQKIPAGEVRSYSDLAKSIDNPNAVRAVARANGANQLAIIIPCHRVIGADGSMTGYAGGLWRKQKLIELERKFR